MLRVFQFILSLFLILLIIPQTPTENIVLRKFLDTGFFTSYSEAKIFLNRLTWISIFLFLGVTYFLSM